MEVTLKRSLLSLTIIILLVNYVLSDVTTIVEGITVAKQKGNLYCDTLTCPKETDLCRVAKIFHPTDDRYFLRIRKCIDSNGIVLKREQIRELVGTFNQTITVTLEGKENGRVIFSDPKPEDE